MTDGLTRRLFLQDVIPLPYFKEGLEKVWRMRDVCEEGSTDQKLNVHIVRARPVQVGDADHKVLQRGVLRVRQWRLGTWYHGKRMNVGLTCSNEKKRTQFQ